MCLLPLRFEQDTDATTFDIRKSDTILLEMQFRISDDAVFIAEIVPHRIQEIAVRSARVQFASSSLPVCVNDREDE
jgi:hypothetical protein